MPMGAPSASDVHVDTINDDDADDLRDIPQSERDAMPASDFAGKGTSFPIRKAEDVMAAVHSIGRAGSDNYDAATLKRNIIAIAKRKGFALPDAWKSESHSAEPNKIKTYWYFADATWPDGSAPTSWIQVARTIDNAVSSRYGTFSITKDHLKQMLANFKKGQPQAPTKVPVDYDHLSMDPQKPGDGIAAGWFVDLEMRNDDQELWGLVEWTPKAADAIKQKEYQGVSPSFSRNFTNKDGKKLGPTLLAAAITNHPFLEGMAPLTLCADGDLALILTGARDMPAEPRIDAAKGTTHTLTDVKGNEVEIADDVLMNSAVVKQLMAKMPKDGEKVVKMSDLPDASEVVSLRAKVTEQGEHITQLRQQRDAERREYHLNRAMGEFNTLLGRGYAIPKEKEDALDLAQQDIKAWDGQSEFKWNMFDRHFLKKHTTAVIKLNAVRGSGDGEDIDLSDPVEGFMSLVASEQKTKTDLTFEKAWDVACAKNPAAYDEYRKAVAVRV